jgi:RNA polymerase sigma factor (sigma-70 family)
MMVDGPPTAGFDLEGAFRAHATGLLRLAAALTGSADVAEELVQDAFVAVGRQERPPSPGAELAYLRRTVITLSHGRFRRIAVVRRHPDPPPSTAPTAESSAERRDVQRRVAAAIRALPDRQRECIVLRCYVEATDREIAEALGISPGSVKTHLHRARTTLATRLEDLR